MSENYQILSIQAVCSNCWVKYKSFVRFRQLLLILISHIHAKHGLEYKWDTFKLLEEGEGSQALIFVKLEKKKRPFAPSQPSILGPNNFRKAAPAAEIVTAQL